MVCGIKNGWRRAKWNLDGIYFPGSETILSSLFAWDPHPRHPILYLKEKDKSNYREIKQSFMGRMKQESKKNRQAFKENKYKAPLSYLEIIGSNKTRAERQGVKEGSPRWHLWREPQPVDQDLRSGGDAHTLLSLLLGSLRALPDLSASWRGHCSLTALWPSGTHSLPLKTLLL